LSRVAGPAVLLLAAALVVVAATATTALLRPEGRLDAVVMGGVSAAVNVTVAVLVVGAVGTLRPGALLTMHLVLAVVPVLLLARRGRLRLRRRQVGARRVGPRAAPWESVLVALAAMALGWQLIVALVLPPYAYDALSYHLTTVATWVRSGTLAPSPLSLCCAYYPSNAELLSAWPAVLLHSDALVDTVQVLAAGLGGLASAAIGRTAGLSRRGAATAGALFVLTPTVLTQAPTAYVDVLLAAFVLAGLHGLGRFAATARPSRLVVPGLCAGLLTGTKGIGLLWAAALVLTACVVAAVHIRRGRLTFARSGRALAAVLLACVLLGGWWYARSAVDTGNPTYPFEVRAGGVTLLRGPVRLSEVLTQPSAGAGRPWPVAVWRSWFADLLPWRHGFYDYQQRLGGLGPLWSWLGLPLLIPLGVGLWRRRAAALAAIVPVLAVLLVQPYRWWARFTLPLAAVGAIAVLVAAEQFRPVAARRVVRIAAVGLAGLGAALVLAEVNPASRAVPLPASQVLTLAGASAQQRTVGRLFLPEYRFLEGVPNDATIVVDLEAEPVRFVYPLFGRQLDRTVLPAGRGPAPGPAWVVTAQGRPLDEDRSKRHAHLVSDERGVRVWAPAP